MPWAAATVVVSARFVDVLSDALIEAGALSVDASDADAGTPAERAFFDEPSGDRGPGWSRARIAALFPLDADLDRALAAAFAAVGVSASTAYEVSRVDDEDWVRQARSQFSPQQITPQLWVVTSWHAAPDPRAINIVLDPGLAFGTGAHPTTRLCLRWLAAHIRRGVSLIDYGCGSGILAIAALKLGAGRASGVDIDPQAVAAARRNAHANHVDASFVGAAEALEGPAQIMVANILARPLIVLAPLLARLTVRGGRLALSGILAEQAEEVSDAYRAWYDFEPAARGRRLGPPLGHPALDERRAIE